MATEVRPVGTYRMQNASAFMLWLQLSIPLVMTLPVIGAFIKFLPGSSTWLFVIFALLCPYFLWDLSLSFRHAQEVQFLADGTVRFRMAFYSDQLNPSSIVSIRPMIRRPGWMAIRHTNGTIIVSGLLEDCEKLIDDLVRLNPLLDDPRGKPSRHLHGWGLCRSILVSIILLAGVVILIFVGVMALIISTTCH